MKRILITGANSYVGTSVENWLARYPDKYVTDTVDTRSDSWNNESFTGYDVIFHVAGIAHVSTNAKWEDLYYKVNRDLTMEVAKKAIVEDVRQFIFMSSIIVYGDSSNVNQKRVIDRNTIPKPNNFYGESKLQAEIGLSHLERDDFKIVILRPPMIYGKGSKGNYPKLARVSLKLPIFPNIENERSMLHIDNLCEFVRLMIDNEERGLFFPQNSEFVKTSEMVQLIAACHGKRIIFTKIFNQLIKLMSRHFKIIDKVFGSLTYEKSISEYKMNYRIRDLKESINSSEEGYC